ncbi:MAG: hypothetical protein R3284_06220 [Rubricoccaceae bacterium]|nr:hypothetical protein [Rubricoccaceae bacterium]
MSPSELHELESTMLISGYGRELAAYFEQFYAEVDALMLSSSGNAEPVLPQLDFQRISSLLPGNQK